MNGEPRGKNVPLHVVAGGELYFLNATPSAKTHDQGNQENYQENVEQELRHSGRRNSDTAKTKHSGNKSNYQKDHSPVEHGASF
jgi:hypothetical protein